jgi:hypothetical protein
MYDGMTLYRAVVVSSSSTTGDINVVIPAALGDTVTLPVSRIGRSAVTTGVWNVPQPQDQVLVAIEDERFSNIFLVPVSESGQLKGLSVSGNLTVSGSVTASTLIGNGASLTNVNHSTLVNLTNDDHTQYYNQTRGDARYLQLSGGTLTGSLSGTGASFTGSLSGTGASFTGSLSGTGASFTGTITAATFSGAHSGDGSALTSLNASNLSSGTVASARISGSYTGITQVGTRLTGLTGVPSITNTDSLLATTNSSADTLQILQANTTTGDAFMTFHASGRYAAHFGVDGSGFFVGGWSEGAKKRVLHTGNTSLITSVGTLGSLSVSGGTLAVSGIGEAIRSAGTNQYIAFWNSGVTTRVGYLQGVNGNDMRLVSEAGALYCAGNTFAVRDGAMTADRLTVTSSAVSVVSGYLEASYAGTPVADGNASIRSTSNSSKTGISIKSYSGYAEQDYFLAFYDATNGSTSVGSIFSPGNTTTTTYSNTSDYRLKRDDKSLTGSLERVLALRPISYRWARFADSPLEEGFFAHEVQTVVPCAVFGEKDAEDDDGNLIAQQIELSRLIPVLVGAVQELADQIKVLTK